jgi:hypothetical protein
MRSNGLLLACVLLPALSLQADEPATKKSAATGKPADLFEFSGLSPDEAAARMTLPEGFSATAFTGEPDVRQPIAMTIDDRGRLWVAEAYGYPIRVPEEKARDRILIFEDADNDGKFDKRSVFAEKLNLVSGIWRSLRGRSATPAFYSRS